MTEADWDRIPAKGGRGAFSVFDYSREARASGLNHIVQLEAKGTVVEDARHHSQTTRTHRRKIEEKKSKIETRESTKDYPYPADIRYGTIGSIGTLPEGQLRCWLVDPEGEGDDGDAGRHRLLSRIRFLRDWITVLSKRSTFAAALNTRLAAIETIDNPFELDRVPLLRGSGELFEEAPWEPGGRTSGWLSTKSRVVDGPAGGMVVQRQDRLIFVGIRQDLITLAATQDFKNILDYEAECATVDKVVRCLIPKGRFEREFFLPEALRETIHTTGGYVEFELGGQLHYGKAGTVVGALPFDQTK